MQWVLLITVFMQGETVLGRAYFDSKISCEDVAYRITQSDNIKAECVLEVMM